MTFHPAPTPTSREDPFTRRLTEERRARLSAEQRLARAREELEAAHAEIDALEEMSRGAVQERDGLKTALSEMRSDRDAAVEQRVLAEQRLFDAIQSVRDGLALFDANGVLITANRAWIGAFDGLDEVRPGIALPDLIALALDEGIVADGVGTNAMLALLSQETPPPCDLTLWTGHRVRLIAQRAPGGDVVVLAINLTRTLRRQTALADARNRAEAATRAKSTFLANMSHEIRTPMNGILGMAESLAGGPLDTDQSRAVETIQSSAQALLEIIGDVLDLSASEAGRLSIRPAAFDLRACADEVITLLRPTAMTRDLTMDFDWQTGLAAQRHGDRGRLRQIVTNLLGNAVKYTDEGGTRLAIAGDADGVLLTVSDTGVGIAAADQAGIFGSFSQVEDAARGREGTGLGLAITQDLVTAMGGTICVQSKPGAGSTFEVALPLPEIADTRATPLVLAADDNATNRLVLKSMLKGADVDLHLVEDGRAAVEAVAKLAPDLVLMDVSMPVMDGLDAARAIRASDRAGTPICALTAHAGAEDHARIRAAGMDDVLTKPLGKAALLDMIAALIPGWTGAAGANLAEPAEAP